MVNPPNHPRLIMNRRACLVFGLSGFLLFGSVLLTSTGCFNDPKKFAQVEGFVYLNGKPLAGASVTFAPTTGAAGNVAVKTDKKGFFSARARIGVNQIAVAKFINAGDPKTPDEFISEMIKNNPHMKSHKSADNPEAHAMVVENSTRVVPQKYESPATSGISEIVDEDGAKNKYKFKLVGQVKETNRTYRDLRDKGKKQEEDVDDLEFMDFK